MDKPNTLEITKTDIILVTPKGGKSGGKLQGNTVWFGQTPIQFSAELVAEIVAARGSLRDAVIKTVRGSDLYDAQRNGIEVYDIHTEGDAVETGKVLVSPAVSKVVVRFAKSDLV